MSWIDALLGALRTIGRTVKALRVRGAAAETPEGQKVQDAMRADLAEIERLSEGTTEPDSR